MELVRPTDKTKSLGLKETKQNKTKTMLNWKGYSNWFDFYPFKLYMPKTVSVYLILAVSEHYTEGTGWVFAKLLKV